MHLTLSPCHGLPGTAETVIEVDRDLLIVDGTEYDLSGVPEGGQATADGDDQLFLGVISRISGVVHCTVRVVLSDDAENDQPTDPLHWVIPDAQGLVDIPARRRASEAVQEVAE